MITLPPKPGTSWVWGRYIVTVDEVIEGLGEWVVRVKLGNGTWHHLSQSIWCDEVSAIPVPPEGIACVCKVEERQTCKRCKGSGMEQPPWV